MRQTCQPKHDTIQKLNLFIYGLFTNDVINLGYTEH
jgi:hypothetical protein